MRAELTKSMYDVIQEVVGLTPKDIASMNMEAIEKYSKSRRRKNKMFNRIFKFRMPKSKKIKFFGVIPRGSMIIAHKRFSYREKTDKLIHKIK